MLGPGPLSGVRVLEFGEHISAPYAARVLAELGADVIKIENLAGDCARRNGPFLDGLPDPESSGLFHALNFEKRSFTFDPGDPQSALALEALLAEAEIFITNLGYDQREAMGLDWTTIGARHPDLVALSVTPFGDSGPYAQAPGCALTAAALGGATWAVGLPERAPLSPPFDVADYQAGIHAASAAMAAYYARINGAKGQVIDISAADVIASYVAANSSFYSAFGHAWHRCGRKASGSGGTYPYGIFPCKDGAVVLIGRSKQDWESLLGGLGSPGWASDPRFEDPREIARSFTTEVDSLLQPLLLEHTVAELVALGEEAKVAIAPVLSIAEVLELPQFLERNLFADDYQVGGHQVSMPTSPLFALRGSGPRVLRQASEQGVQITQAKFDKPKQRSPDPSARSTQGAGRGAGPLSGVRVIDLSWVWSGPYATAILADLGAEVIKIEHRDRLDNARLRGRPLKDGKPAPGPVEEISPYFHQNNRNKLSVTLNIKDPDGARLLRELIAESDVVLNNFTAGVLERVGLSYERLSEGHPGLIMLSMTAAGSTGPLRDIRGYAPIMSALSGIESLVGYDDERAIGMMTFALGDPNAGIHAAGAILGALIGRARTGEGLDIDLSQTEAMVGVVAEAAMYLQLTGDDPSGRGTDHPQYCPHGIFPCAGDDSWLALAVAGDAEWERVAEVLGEPIEGDPRFAHEDGRRANRDALDTAIAARTASFDRDELVGRLRAVSVAAAPVLELAELQEDPHLRDRGVFAVVDHQITGPGTLATLPWIMSATPPAITRSAPLVGEHTHEVLQKTLNLTPAEIERLEASGAIR